MLKSFEEKKNGRIRIIQTAAILKCIYAFVHDSTTSVNCLLVNGFVK